MVTKKTVFDREAYKVATTKTLEETVDNTTRNIIRGWDDNYLEYNMKSGKRDIEGRYQIEYDEIAETMLAKEQAKATLGFDTETDHMKFMLNNEYYREDLLRDGITLDDVEDLYKVYKENDIGFNRMYSRLIFTIAFAMRVTDESLYRKGLNKLIPRQVRLDVERQLMLTEDNIITDEVLQKSGHTLTKAEIKAVENAYKVSDETLTINQLNRLYTDEILEVLGIKREFLPTARFDEKYILLETRDNRSVVHALDIVGGKPFTIDNVKESIQQQALREFQASTPSFANAGLKNGGEKISCTIIKIDDNLDSIKDRLGDILTLSKMGSGIGVIPEVRATSESVRELENRSHGAIKLAKMIENNVQYADQDGKRQGSAVYNIDVFNVDYRSLLEAKKENVDESVRLSLLSIGLVMRNKLFYLFLSGVEGFYTFYPHTVYKEYGVKLSEMNLNEMYDELVSNPRVRKEYILFENFIDDVGSAVSESGYPYPIFRDNMSADHAFYEEDVDASNLCTEISQSLTSEQAIQCNLASLDVLHVMSNKSLAKVATTLVNHLNGVMDNTDFSKVPVVQRGMDARRAIGIGTANFQGFLASEGIPYESETAIDFARVFYSNLNYWTLKQSMQLAKDKVYPVFENFEKTTYFRGDYFDRYLGDDVFLPTTDKVTELFEEMELVTQDDWKQLKADVQKYGLVNAYRLAIAPNGTTSYSMGGTSGIAPNTQLVETRKTASMGSAMYPMPNLEPSNYFMYKDAFRVDDFKYFDLISAIQLHIDQGISTTMYITDDYTTSDWWTRVVYAWAIGLKTLYFTRPKISGKIGKDGSMGEAIEVENFEECESCLA